MIPVHVRLVLGVLLLAPAALMANALLVCAGRVSPLTANSVASLCLATLTLCNSLLLLARAKNAEPQRLSDIR